MIKKVIGLCFLILIIFSQVSHSINVDKTRNGVKIISHKMESDIIALDIWVRAGSRNENPNINGISHFIEHLIFKGSKKFKVGETDKIIEGAGGIINAATSKDFTHFYIVVPKKYFKKAAEVLGDLLTNPLFDPIELEKERKVVLEEIYRSQSQPRQELYNLVFAKSFRYSTYRYPVLGSLASVSYLDRDTISKYFKTYYAGKNITIIATGGLPNNVVSLLKKEFKNIPSLKRRLYSPKTEMISENNLLESKKKVAKAYLDIAFSSPAASSFDSYVLDLIITIMGNGRNSRLNKEIKENAGLVHSITIGYPTPIAPNLIIIGAVCDPLKVDSATQKIFYELNRLKTDPVSDYELKKAKTIIAVDNKITYSQPQDLASHLGYFATVANNINYEKDYMKNINMVSKQDIQRVAGKYFSYYTIGRFLPE
ncbi:MAG: insulinase family protein [Candidatus Saganbacteria bacterium]|nr:insulinase family protein [Candidatus Saganbacteria bacterium]